jgi:diguanylate cyclase (GGDEF)-like protein
VSTLAPILLAGLVSVLVIGQVFPETPDKARMWAGVFTACAFFAALVFSFIAGGNAVRSLRELRRTVDRIRKGDLDARYRAKGPAEVNEVGRAVNQIAEQLQGTHEDFARETADIKQRETGKTRELQQANRLLMDIANRDALTGLANRRRLELDLDRNIKLSQRTGVPLAVIMMDLDRFKQYNDTAGHLAGDTLLQNVAHNLRARARSTDLVVRWGGDEFCILVPGTSPDGAVIAAEGFVDAVTKAAEVSPLPEGTLLVGASAGVACYPGDGDDSTELIAHADASLYQAKESGRGRVVRLPQG